ncbi:hypothetical protein NXS19_005784 [Fusarium pseudograminearum]|nr:hypothetical protein NXS19_005784 [Fusarium pseudograminearum]
MTTSKLIVVVGATGGQGGSVVETFLKDPTWLVHMVRADLNDQVSLAKAFRDANVIFAISDFWGIYSESDDTDKPEPGSLFNEWVKQKETQQLKSIIDEAAKITSLERFVISSLPNVTKLTDGKYTEVCHFDSKANAVEYGERHQPDLWSKTSVFVPGYFLRNFLSHPMSQPTKGDNGCVQFSTNLDLDNKLPFIFTWDCEPELRDEFRETFAFVNEVGLHGGDNAGYIHPFTLETPPDVQSIEAWISEQNWEKVLGS